MAAFIVSSVLASTRSASRTFIRSQTRNSLICKLGAYIPIKIFHSPQSSNFVCNNEIKCRSFSTATGIPPFRRSKLKKRVAFITPTRSRIGISLQTENCSRVKSFSTSSSDPSSHDSRICWKCGRNTKLTNELFFCECGIVQKPADNLTYFDLMQEDVTFDLDHKSLGTKFRDTQKRLHPDMFSSKSQEELHLAEEQSSLLNKAYQTLLKPLSRSIYMLKLKNVKIDEKDTITDSDFLMDIMIINEQISEASSTKDIDNIEAKNNNVIARCIKDISQAFKDGKVEDAKKATIKLRYYTTIQERINELRRSNFG